MQALQSFGRLAGTMGTANEMLGCIRQDIGTDLLVMPVHCNGFGGILPPFGTRITFDVVVDASLGTIRAEGVQPETAQPNLGALVPCQPQQSQFDMSNALALASLSTQPALLPTERRYSEGRQSGIFDREKGTFGFIKQDSGEADMFVMPRGCAVFNGSFPPIGTRVVYEVVVDEKTKKPRAENVRPGCSGTMDRVKGTFGFIKQDSGEDDMFVMPRGCAAFNDTFPPIGCRVVYEVVLDSKTGKPRAEDVQPMLKGLGTSNLDVTAAGQLPFAPHHLAGALPQLALTDNLLGFQRSTLQLGHAQDEHSLDNAAAGTDSNHLNNGLAGMPSSTSLAMWMNPLTAPDDEHAIKRRRIES